jgi:Uma2 family endonuclease
MSTAPPRLLTPAEYLAQERQAEFKSEYYRGEVFAMAGARFPHNQVKHNLDREIGNQLKGGPCQIASSDQRVKVDRPGLYTYPALVIVCGEPQFEDAVQDTLLNPRVIIEVLSESAEKYDRGAKFAMYRQSELLQEYVLVSQDQPLIERYVRQPDGSWLLTELNNLAQTFELASAPARVPLAEIYHGVTFPGPPEAGLAGPNLK